MDLPVKGDLVKVNEWAMFKDPSIPTSPIGHALHLSVKIFPLGALKWYKIRMLEGLEGGGEGEGIRSTLVSLTDVTFHLYLKSCGKSFFSLQQ